MPVEFNLEEQKQEEPFDPNAVIEFYHKKLYENSNALLYLEKLGLKKKANYERFKIGFAPRQGSGQVDGSLINILSKKQKALLKKLNLIGEDDTEYFNNCIIFPIFNTSGILGAGENEKVSGIYGFDIAKNEFLKPVYLSEKIPIFNQRATKSYDEIILTENIIEALSLIELYIENVITINDSKDITENHITILKNNRVKTIVLGLTDELTKDSLKDLFIKQGFNIRVVSPPKPHFSFNKALQNNIERNQITEALIEAEIFKPEKPKGLFQIKKDKGIYTFITDEVTYHLAGIKDIFTPNLKVKIRIEREEKYHRDYLDLYPYRTRQNFSNTASGRLDVNAARIEKDLDRILDYFEEEREKKTNTAVSDDIDVMTEEDIKTGMGFLKSPDLISQTITDITSIGYAGEDNNKLLVYVIGMSRNLPKPLSLFALSSPGSGKSYLVDSVLKLFPAERLKHNSSLSDQAFHYMPESDFDGNIFVMGESLHNPIIEGYIRQMQTENMLSRSVVRKDEATGEMKTINITHKVRLVFMTTSTYLDPNIENISRCILLKIDESVDQTERVHKRQRYKRTHEGILADRHVIPQIIKKHIIAQRLLKPVMIVNPFAEYIDFPKHKSILRRSQEHFLITIESICFWRQYQKEVVKKFNPYLKIDEDFIECDLLDYELARKLFIECRLLSGIEEIPDQMVFLYDRIQEMLRKNSKKENVAVEEISFIQADVRELEGLSIGNESIKRYIRMMVDYEFLQVIGGKRHKVKLSYKLRGDKPIKKINVAEIIPTVEQIKEMMRIGEQQS
jgi:hypothetical protein